VKHRKKTGEKNQKTSVSCRTTSKGPGYIIGVPKGEKNWGGVRRAETVFEEILAELFPNLMKTINS